ncbi:unnamed protein product [Amoebophrya sp. A25]|nr:unnamed protein product [Amoebophrya sp. A25]|eukprot:GSA25T00001275001.1
MAQKGNMYPQAVQGPAGGKGARMAQGTMPIAQGNAVQPGYGALSPPTQNVPQQQMSAPQQQNAMIANPQKPLAVNPNAIPAHLAFAWNIPGAKYRISFNARVPQQAIVETYTGSASSGRVVSLIANNAGHIASEYLHSKVKWGIGHYQRYVEQTRTGIYFAHLTDPATGQVQGQSFYNSENNAWSMMNFQGQPIATGRLFAEGCCMCQTSGVQIHPNGAQPIDGQTQTPVIKNESASTLFFCDKTEAGWSQITRKFYLGDYNAGGENAAAARKAIKEQEPAFIIVTSGDVPVWTELVMTKASAKMSEEQKYIAALQFITLGVQIAAISEQLLANPLAQHV